MNNGERQGFCTDESECGYLFYSGPDKKSDALNRNIPDKSAAV